MGKRLSKIYTRTGDQGLTGLGDGNRVSKSAPRVQAMGSIDEFNSWLGMAIEEIHLVSSDALSGVSGFLKQCQHRTFDLGGEMSIPDFVIIQAHHVVHIEVELDRLNQHLAPLENFILPGGNKLIATLHMARSVCRRAERDMVTLAETESINSEGLKFLNRMSDYLFVAARYSARCLAVPEVLWEKDTTGDQTQ